MSQRVGIVIQARMGSMRLPGKALMSIQGQPMLRRLYERVALTRRACSVSVATSCEPRDSAIVDACHSWGVPVVQGPEDDLTIRLLIAARKHELTALIRVTGDNPLTDPAGLDALIDAFLEKNCDLVHSQHRNGYIYGTGAELMKVTVLEQCDSELTDILDREPVFMWVRQHPSRFTCCRIETPAELLRPGYFLTVDYPEDLRLVERIYQHFGGRNDMRLREILAFLDANSELPKINAHLHQQFTD